MISWLSGAEEGINFYAFLLATLIAKGVRFILVPYTQAPSKRGQKMSREYYLSSHQTRYCHDPHHGTDAYGVSYSVHRGVTLDDDSKWMKLSRKYKPRERRWLNAKHMSLIRRGIKIELILFYTLFLHTSRYVRSFNICRGQRRNRTTATRGMLWASIDCAGMVVHTLPPYKLKTWKNIMVNNP